MPKHSPRSRSSSRKRRRRDHSNPVCRQVCKKIKACRKCLRPKCSDCCRKIAYHCRCSDHCKDSCHSCLYSFWILFSRFVDSIYFEILSGSVIVLNCVAVGWYVHFCPPEESGRSLLDDCPSESLLVVQHLGTAFFMIEFLCRGVVFRFFYHVASLDRIIDTLVIGFACYCSWIAIPVISQGLGQKLWCVTFLRCIRLIRKVWLFFLPKSVEDVSIFPPGFLVSAKALLAMAFEVFIFMSIFGMLAVIIIADSPNWGDNYDVQELFGGLDRAMLTLLQVISGGGWILKPMRPMLETLPGTWLLLISYALLATLLLLYLLATVVVEAKEGRTSELIDWRQRKLAELGEALDAGGWKEIDRSNFETICNSDPAVIARLGDLGFNAEEISCLVHDLDVGEGVLSLDCFLKSLCSMQGKAQGKDLIRTQKAVERLHRRMDSLFEMFEQGDRIAKEGSQNGETRRSSTSQVATVDRLHSRMDLLFDILDPERKHYGDTRRSSLVGVGAVGSLQKQQRNGSSSPGRGRGGRVRTLRRDRSGDSSGNGKLSKTTSTSTSQTSMSSLGSVPESEQHGSDLLSERAEAEMPTSPVTASALQTWGLPPPSTSELDASSTSVPTTTSHQASGAALVPAVETTSGMQEENAAPIESLVPAPMRRKSICTVDTSSLEVRSSPQNSPYSHLSLSPELSPFTDRSANRSEVDRGYEKELIDKLCGDIRNRLLQELIEIKAHVVKRCRSEIARKSNVRKSEVTRQLRRYRTTLSQDLCQQFERLGEQFLTMTPASSAANSPVKAYNQSIANDLARMSPGIMLGSDCLPKKEVVSQRQVQPAPRLVLERCVVECSG